MKLSTDEFSAARSTLKKTKSLRCLLRPPFQRAVARFTVGLSRAPRSLAFLSADRSFQRGQAVLEYILIMAVIIGLFMIVVRPRMADIQQKLAEGLKAGALSSDPNSGTGYPYYFPMK